MSTTFVQKFDQRLYVAVWQTRHDDIHTFVFDFKPTETEVASIIQEQYQPGYEIDSEAGDYISIDGPFGVIVRKDD